MALVISDRIKETTNTVGTQTYQLEGAVTGFETFASNLSDGDTTCLLYTSPSPRDFEASRMPSSA